MSDLDLDAAQALADAATEAPWRVGGPPMTSEVWSGREADFDSFLVAQCTTRLNPEASPRSEADAEFIAAARELVPALCNELRAARERIMELEGQQL